MEKTVPNKHSRRHSTGNFYIELNGYEDVLSRYLSAPFPSCHDNCKPHPPGSDQPTHPKPTRKRPNKTDTDSQSGIKKTFAPIPRSPTRHAKITSNSLPKHQVKSQPLVSKSQDFKSKSNLKSKTEENDPFYIQPSSITRRFSDVNLHTNDLDVHVSPVVGGLVRGSKRYDKKIDSRKDVKPIKSNVKTPGDRTVTKKVQNLKTLSGSTNPGIDHGSKKSKSKSADPVGQLVQEKNNKSQNANENRVLQNGEHIASKSEKDEAPESQSQSQSQHQSQNNGSTSMADSLVKKTENTTRVRKLAKENEELSSQKVKFRQGKTIGSQSESNGPRKVTFEKGKVLDENQTGQEGGKNLRRLSSDGVSHTPESNSVSVVLKACEVEVDKQNTRLNNVIEETASRLIRTRKSKVQALVGAFEMISGNEI